jgi:biopolymer transport protein ExbD
MSRRRRYELPTKKHSTFTLNITSMTDMFTILLVFLLQTYSTSQVEITPEKDIRLPASSTQANPVEAIKLSVSPMALKIGDHKIADLQNADFTRQDLDANDTNFIRPLFDELEKITKESGEDPTKSYVKEGKILLQADQELPYSVIRKVMYTASMAGYPQLKLVTVVGD